MFQFPRFPPLVLCVQTRVTPHDGCRVSPFGYLRIGARSTAPRSFSQSPTSFIGSRRQGIHRWLFVAWKSKMLVLAMEFSRCAVSGSTAPAAARPSHCWGAVCRVAPRIVGRDPRRGPRASAATRRVAAITGGLPLQNGTEGQDLRLGTVGGNCTFDGRAAWGPSSQWSTGCSLE
jgi:hypothetical protein